MVAAGVLFAGFLFFGLCWTLEDITTRADNTPNHRIAEVRTAAALVGTEFGDRAPGPLVQFVSQGTDADLLGYAKFYAAGGTPGSPRTLFRTAGSVSWSSGKPENLWQQKSSQDELVRIFKSADIIWPIITDPWIDGLLRGLLNGDQSCGSAVTRYVWLKQKGG